MALTKTKKNNGGTTNTKTYQGNPPTPPRAHQTNQPAKAPGIGKKVKSSDPWIAYLLKPFASISRNIEWATDSGQGGKNLAYTLAFFGVLLSAEAIYCKFPNTPGGVTVENRKFFPKPGIEDGAQITNLIHLGDLLDSTQQLFGFLFPYEAKAKPKQPLRSIALLDPNFYAALLIAIAITYVESKALRKVSAEVRIARAERIKNYRAPVPAEDAIRLAHVRAKEAHNAEMGGYIMTGVVIVGCYAIEGVSAFTTMGTGAPIVKLIWGLATMFGAEFCWNAAKEDEADSEVNLQTA